MQLWLLGNHGSIPHSRFQYILCSQSKEKAKQHGNFLWFDCRRHGRSWIQLNATPQIHQPPCTMMRQPSFNHRCSIKRTQPSAILDAESQSGIVLWGGAAKPRRIWDEGGRGWELSCCLAIPTLGFWKTKWVCLGYFVHLCGNRGCYCQAWVAGKVGGSWAADVDETGRVEDW